MRQRPKSRRSSRRSEVRRKTQIEAWVRGVAGEHPPTDSKPPTLSATPESSTCIAKGACPRLPSVRKTRNVGHVHTVGIGQHSPKHILDIILSMHYEHVATNARTVALLALLTRPARTRRCKRPNVAERNEITDPDFRTVPVRSSHLIINANLRSTCIRVRCSRSGDSGSREGRGPF